MCATHFPEAGILFYELLQLCSYLISRLNRLILPAFPHCLFSRSLISSHSTPPCGVWNETKCSSCSHTSANHSSKVVSGVLQALFLFLLPCTVVSSAAVQFVIHHNPMSFLERLPASSSFICSSHT